MADDEQKSVATEDVDLESGGGVTNPGFEDDSTKNRKAKEAEAEAEATSSGDKSPKPVVITAGKAGTQQATGGVESGYRRVEPSAPVEKKSKRVAGAGLVCMLILLLIVVIVLLAVFLTGGSTSSSANAITPTPATSGGGR